ncbi:hypothetical protein GEV33_002722 [Tenebrio molitor]|uniref:Ig-like domain-containing protein n=1 Tax=Tenebrio molitor TaxID=7067 RepID=A0A8J6HSW3_TENMO|nr:hypothetical protein GEV33_002722 [Tenebrio molitor]
MLVLNFPITRGSSRWIPSLVPPFLTRPINKGGGGGGGGGRGPAIKSVSLAPLCSPLWKMGRYESLCAPSNYATITVSIQLPKPVKPTDVILTYNDKEVNESTKLEEKNQGEAVILTCKAPGGKPIPTVSWYNGSQLINMGESSGARKFK